MPMRNRVGRTSLHAIPAKDTTVVIDVVDLGVALGAAYAVLGGIVGGFDVDAVRRTVGGAEEAGYALFQSVLVALQNVRAAEARFEPRSLERTLAVGIVFYRRGLEHLHEGDAHALGDGGDVFQDGHAFLVYRKAVASGQCFAFTDRFLKSFKTPKAYADNLMPEGRASVIFGQYFLHSFRE